MAHLRSSFSSVQQVELTILIHLLQLFHKPLNIVSGSANVVGLFPAVETALILSSHSVMISLLQELQNPGQTHLHLFLTHTHAYSNLPDLTAEEIGKLVGQGYTCHCRWIH